MKYCDHLMKKVILFHAKLRQRKVWQILHLRLHLRKFQNLILRQVIWLLRRVIVQVSNWKVNYISIYLEYKKRKRLTPSRTMKALNVQTAEKIKTALNETAKAALAFTCNSSGSIFTTLELCRISCIIYIRETWNSSQLTKKKIVDAS